MFAHVGCKPVRDWLESAALECGTMGYARVGTWQAFSVEIGPVP
jgi:hypothetical protein